MINSGAQSVKKRAVCREKCKKKYYLYETRQNYFKISLKLPVKSILGGKGLYG
jgi:hypothetical protein